MGFVERIADRLRSRRYGTKLHHGSIGDTDFTMWTDGEGLFWDDGGELPFMDLAAARQVFARAYGLDDPEWSGIEVTDPPSISWSPTLPGD
ncbi:MAG: hypothetical protein AAGC53_03910 [Actinomycetota bacterium]